MSLPSSAGFDAYLSLAPDGPRGFATIEPDRENQESGYTLFSEILPQVILYASRG